MNQTRKQTQTFDIPLSRENVFATSTNTAADAVALARPTAPEPAPGRGGRRVSTQRPPGANGARCRGQGQKARGCHAREAFRKAAPPQRRLPSALPGVRSRQC